MSLTTSHNPQRVRGVTETVDLHLPELRGNLTPQERVLWDALRGRRLDGGKFRRQYPIGTFVLDFYASELRLIVELDGNIHDDPRQRSRDARRDAHFTAHRYRMVRITNMEVVLDLPAVLGRLSAAISDLRGGVALTPGPSPDPDPGRGENEVASPNHGRGENVEAPLDHGGGKSW